MVIDALKNRWTRWAYPSPPWTTSGIGYVRAFATPVDALDLPRGFEAVHVAGWTIGVLAYLEHRPPAALAYRELLWMPGVVRAVDAGGLPRAGFLVGRSYVDDERAQQGGRDLWALPRELARFVRRADGVEMFADDGTEMELAFGHAGPAVRVDRPLVTLQPEPGGLVGLRADVTARIALGRVRVMRFAGDSLPWRSWLERRDVPIAAVALQPFAATLRAADRWPRRLSGVFAATAPRASA
ncbi:MAG: hypothetical protein JWM10_87 [Myxococcaceae bacterium]|nr:hypothetical protein [Myxococcaceae bacterium]